MTSLNTAPNLRKLIYSIDFEVHGTVQGVFFRKYTEKKANELGIHGWCRNTSHRTVQGIIQHSDNKVIDDMKHWLQTKGSPKSKISSVDFKNERTLHNFEYPNFQIKH